MLSPDGRSAVRLAVAGLLGVVAAVVTGLSAGWAYAAVVGWIVAAAAYLIVTWLVIRHMDADRTRSHSTREDPTRAVSDLVVVVASIASLGGVAFLLVDASGGGGEASVAAALGIGSVAASWLVVHTLFTLRYALIYYREPVGGISFNQQEPPAYADFAYLAFTLGMTYQVSDTNLQDRAMRSTALRHALLSYLLGAIVLATTINLVAGLGSG